MTEARRNTNREDAPAKRRAEDGAEHGTQKTPRLKRRGRSLTTGMIRVIITCQIIPYIVLSAVLIWYYSSRNHEQIGRTVRTSVENAGTLVMDNLSSVLELSRQASYDGVIKKSYEAYLKDGDESAMYREVSAYLNRTYKFSKIISNTILLYSEPMTMEYYTYSNVAGATYASIDEFKKNTAEAVRKVTKDLDTRTAMICLSGHFYVVRNLVRSNYEPFTTLVMEVNMDRLFARLDNVLWQQEWIVILNGERICVSSDGLEEQESDRLFFLWEASGLSEEGLREGEVESLYESGEAAAVMKFRINDQYFFVVHRLDRSEILSSRSGFLTLYIVVFITLIPLVIATFYFFYTNVNKPIGALVRGSEQIQSGAYGCRVEPFRKNEEIGRLVDTFNHMSVSLEESFNRIYVEEIAERDATLKALQSQINPHFLNNTLEIINWKARMNGNEDVSEMISALSVMMNATLNRNNEMFIPLSEELSYVDAYLYIIRQRFGSKFIFSQEVDEHLLNLNIPRLIIQPIVENAVDHGGDQKGVIRGRLRVWEEEPFLYIEVENNGSLSEQDREKIAKLLGEKETEGMDRRSIGIRNVHLRLRMLYGQESGLTITDGDSETTVSRIRIRRDRKEAEQQEAKPSKDGQE